MKILIFFASGLGDALFVAPSIFALKKIYPDAKITAVIPQIRFNKFILEKVIAFDTIIRLDRLRSLKPSAIISYIRFIIKLSLTIRYEKYDMVINTIQARLPDQYFLTLCSGAQRKIGSALWDCKKNSYRFLLTDSFTSSIKGHICEKHFDILRLLVNDHNLSIDKYLKELHNKLRENAQNPNVQLHTRRLVIVLPGSGSQHYKRWSFLNFITVIKHILNNYNYDIALLGGNGEYDDSLIPHDLKAHKRFHNIGSELSVSEIIGLLLKTDMVVGNDNGLLHLAEFLEIPTIGIYTTNWGRLSAKYLNVKSTHIVLPKNREDIIFRYLVKHTWKGHKFQNQCTTILSQIHPDEVIREIDKVFINKPFEIA
ncbi:MAG: glycosyltransferase family 9 protein [bacterium]